MFTIYVFTTLNNPNNSLRWIVGKHVDCYVIIDHSMIHLSNEVAYTHTHTIDSEIVHRRNKICGREPIF